MFRIGIMQYTECVRAKAVTPHREARTGGVVAVARPDEGGERPNFNQEIREGFMLCGKQISVRDPVSSNA